LAVVVAPDHIITQVVVAPEASEVEVEAVVITEVPYDHLIQVLIRD
jgi:hypothetical protein